MLELMLQIKVIAVLNFTKMKFGQAAFIHLHLLLLLIVFLCVSGSDRGEGLEV